jgi:hypothetical protein
MLISLNSIGFSQILQKSIKLIEDSTGTYLLVSDKQSKAGRILKLERDYFKSYSNSLTKQLEDSRLIIESLESENALYESNRVTTLDILDSERSINILTNEELKDLKKRFRKRGFVIAGISTAWVLSTTFILYVTLGKP